MKHAISRHFPYKRCCLLALTRGKLMTTLGIELADRDCSVFNVYTYMYMHTVDVFKRRAETYYLLIKHDGVDRLQSCVREGNNRRRRQ